MTTGPMYKDPSEFTILSCLSDIVENTASYEGVYNSRKFNEEVFEEYGEEISYVCRMVGICSKEAVILASIIENKRGRFDKHDLAGNMGLSYLKLLSYDEYLKRLSDKKLITITKSGNISIGKKTLEALATNKPYVIPEAKGLTSFEVLKEMRDILAERENEELDLEQTVSDIDALFRNNSEAGIVKESKALGMTGADMKFEDRLIFYVLAKRYFFDNDDQVSWYDFDDIIDDNEMGYYQMLYNSKGFAIMQKGIMEPCMEDGMASPQNFHLADSVKEKIFAEVGGVRRGNSYNSLRLIQPSEIQEKELFHNDCEGEQVRRLSSLLSPEKYGATCERLKKSGMRTGFTCLFYGGPGTGKTESVYQIAKATGRSIIPVNVSEIKSCWVGESEKLVKGVFDQYSRIVKESDVAPILLFNEADAIFGIRQEGAQRAVDKMENAIQNIILQEMEKLSGILIATTNLTQNLDKAFERRFLYKVKFNKPGAGPKAKIWKSMIPQLSEDEARRLAEGYDFSGGQIENISRKKMITSIIDGVEPGFDEIRSYCGEELIEGKGGEGRKIGF